MQKAAVINPERCDRKPFCPAMRFCPQKAISQKRDGGFLGGGLSIVDNSKCTGCGLCMKYCPRKAINMISI